VSGKNVVFFTVCAMIFFAQFSGRHFRLSLLTPPAAWFRHALNPGRIRLPAKGRAGRAGSKMRQGQKGPQGPPQVGRSKAEPCMARPAVANCEAGPP